MSRVCGRNGSCTTIADGLIMDGSRLAIGFLVAVEYVLVYAGVLGILSHVLLF